MPSPLGQRCEAILSRARHVRVHNQTFDGADPVPIACRSYARACEAWRFRRNVPSGLEAAWILPIDIAALDETGSFRRRRLPLSSEPAAGRQIDPAFVRRHRYP